jgi:hypothetical protein
MTYRLFLILIALAIVFCLTCGVCGDLLDQPGFITLERGPCFGLCPVYSVTVYENGSYIYQGDSNTPHPEYLVGITNETVFSELVSRFDEAGFFGMNDKYTEYLVTDMASAILTVQTGNQIKTVEHYFGDMNAPPILYDLENAVDTVLNLSPVNSSSGYEMIPGEEI